VLVVDDVSSNRKMLIRILKMQDLCGGATSSGGSTIEAVDGVCAVEVMSKALRGEGPMPDVILMDFVMPNMTGPEATAAIRELGYKGLVLGVTGNALPDDIDYFRKCGADDVFLKPVDVSKLKETIQSYLASDSAITWGFKDKGNPHVRFC
jgi:CheY-like chemotaxis protein